MPTLHPQIVKVLEVMAKLDLKPIEAMSPGEARQQMEETAKSRRAEPLPVARVEERMMAGPAGPIPLRPYLPNAARLLPAIAHYHGGGPVSRAPHTHAPACP